MTQPATPDVLQLGPDQSFWTQRRQRRLGWAMIGLALIIAVVSGSHWWREARDPDLTRDEIVSVYGQGRSATGQAGWDPATVSTRSDGTELFLPESQPAECAVLMAPDRSPASLDNVQVALTPLRGSSVTYRYDDAADAGLKFTQLQDAVGRCGRFAFAGTGYRVDRLSVGAVTATRADLTFHVSASNRSGATRLDLLRYANTVTWISTADRQQPGPGPRLVADSLADGFRAVR